MKDESDRHAHAGEGKVAGKEVSKEERSARWEFNPLSANASRPTPSFGLSEAFPCRSIQADTGSVHVELDPLAEVQVRAAIEGRRMQVVGWYHSHPVFAPQPSIRDVQNQTNYQYLFHDKVGRASSSSSSSKQRPTLP